MGEQWEWRPWRPIMWTYRGWAARLPNNYAGARGQAIRTLLDAGERPAYTPGEDRRFWQVWKPGNRCRSGFVVEGDGDQVRVHYLESPDTRIERLAAPARYAKTLQNAGYEVSAPPDGDPVIKAVAGEIKPVRRVRWRRRPVP